MSTKYIRFRIILVFSIIALVAAVGLMLTLRQTSVSKSDVHAEQTLTDQPTTASDTTKAASKALTVGAAETDQKLSDIRWIAVGTTASIVVIAILGVCWILFYFTRSLRVPEAALEELVQGNTKIRIPDMQNEFSTITKAIGQLSSNVQRSSQFAEKIGEGNFEYDFKPAGKDDTLGNSLLQMREKLKNIAEADKIRNWSTHGLAMFADLIRKGGDQGTLSDTLISQLVKYTKSNQGGLYIAQHDDGKDLYLDLTACYAYDRKKFGEKKIDIGEGLIGQCFLEGSSINLRQVPNEYVSITSGLGMSNPRNILLVPLKLNDSVVGVVELASFSHYTTHEIEFVERVGEMIASAISAARITDQTKKMLEESQQQSEEMRAQEEEMRQNMEEMQATQEAMERQTNEMKRMQESLEVEKSMFTALMDALPDRITYKDPQSRITRINKAKALRLNMRAEEVIGKTDYDFFAAEHAEKAMREEKALLDSGKPLLDIEELLTFTNGETAWVSSSRIPFKNEHNVTTGMFIISKDITKLKHAELNLDEKTNILRQLFNEFPLIQYSVDKNRRIHNVITGDVDHSESIKEVLTEKSIQDVVPNVANALQSKTKEAASVRDSISGGYTLKQFIFENKVQKDSYTVVAIVE